MTAAARSSPPAGLPPGPELPPARQTARWMARPAQFLHSLQRRYGDVFTIHLQQEQPWVVVSDPAAVKEVFTAATDVLHAGEPRRILQPVMGPESVLLNDGARHLRQRRLLLPPFHGARVTAYERTMRAVAAAEIERWPEHIAAPAEPRMGAITLEVILRTVFGVADEGRLAALRTALAQLMRYLSTSARTAFVALGDSSRLRDDRFAEFRAALERADEMVFAEVRRRRAEGDGGGEGDDVLSLLLEARHEDGSPMSDRELRDELMTLLVAGQDTTAASLAWALERLAREPQALERTAAEAPAGGGPYTEAVIQETLRLRPVFMHLARRVKKPFRLHGHRLPPGVTVAVGIPLVHSRPDTYPEPFAFRPERFLEQPPGTYTWIPFGGGVRRCIGAAFALHEMRVVLSTLLAHATVRVEEPAAEPARRRMLVMAPARGANVVLERR